MSQIFTKVVTTKQRYKLEISKNQIEIKLVKAQRGELFFAEDFIKYASSDNVRKIPSRLERAGLIERLAHGFYIKPKKDPLLGTIYPNIGEIVKEIAKRDKARID